jgi:hypothetical protein
LNGAQEAEGSNPFTQTIVNRLKYNVSGGFCFTRQSVEKAKKTNRDH